MVKVNKSDAVLKGSIASDDEVILALFRLGGLDAVAAACGTSVVRAAHDMNRVLNKQTVGMNFAKFRERLPL